MCYYVLLCEDAKWQKQIIEFNSISCQYQRYEIQKFIRIELDACKLDFAGNRLEIAVASEVANKLICIY